MAIRKLDKAATDAFHEWKKQTKEEYEAKGRAIRARQTFIEAFGDRDRAHLADGRTVTRTREDRGGYEVLAKTIERYILSSTKKTKTKKKKAAKKKVKK